MNMWEDDSGVVHDLEAVFARCRVDIMSARGPVVACHVVRPVTCVFCLADMIGPMGSTLEASFMRLSKYGVP